MSKTWAPLPSVTEHLLEYKRWVAQRMFDMTAISKSFFNLPGMEDDMFDGPRASGRTTAVCKAAKEINAIVVCATPQHAQVVNREHDVMTWPMCALDRMVGLDRPALWDHFAVEHLLRERNRLAAKAKEVEDVQEWKRREDAKMRETLHGLRETHQRQLDAKDEIINALREALNEEVTR